jgi:hypothetical protein
MMATFPRSSSTFKISASFKLCWTTTCLITECHL